MTGQCQACVKLASHLASVLSKFHFYCLVLVWGFGVFLLLSFGILEQSLAQDSTGKPVLILLVNATVHHGFE